MESKQQQQPAAAVQQPPREHPNIINVSNKRGFKFYIDLGKNLLNEHDWIEFQALGNAISTAVQSAESLVRYNYGQIKEIQTKTISLDSEREKGQQIKKAKLFIRLEKNAKFTENYAEYAKIKAERDQARAAKKEATPAATTTASPQ